MVQKMLQETKNFTHLKRIVIEWQHINRFREEIHNVNRIRGNRIGCYRDESDEYGFNRNPVKRCTGLEI